MKPSWLTFNCVHLDIKVLLMEALIDSCDMQGKAPKKAKVAGKAPKKGARKTQPAKRTRKAKK